MKAVIILYPIFGLISFSNNGVIRDYVAAMASYALTRIFWSFRSILQDILC